MGSIEEVVASNDPDRIKKKRSSIQAMTTTIQNRLGKQLEKSAGKFDHNKIERHIVQGDYAHLKKQEENFDIIHEAYLQSREVGKDNTEEGSCVMKQEKHYNEVVDKIYESLKLYADYEESYEIYKAAQPDPDLAKKEAEEKFAKEALVRQLKDEEVLRRQEADAATKADDERIMKEMRAQVVESELVFKESVGMFRTAKKCAHGHDKVC